MNQGSDNSINGRPVGVRTPEGQLSPGTGAPREVVNFVEVRTFAVEYVDDQGNRHIDVANCIGGVWHLAPNGENYAKTLKALRGDTWLAKALTARLRDVEGQKLPTTVPKEDAVDVTGEG